MLAGPVKRMLDKRNLPICQEAAKAIDPYFDLLGQERVILGMMPLQMLFVLQNGKHPNPEAVESAIRMGSAQSGIPASVLRLHAECLFGQRKDAKPASTASTTSAGDTV